MKYAPTIANIGINLNVKLSPNGVVIVRSVTMKPAPVLTPSMLESAKGFAVSVCSNSPDIPKAPPPKIATIILGSLIS